jgi:uncharacterized integral membrane protein
MQNAGNKVTLKFFWIEMTEIPLLLIMAAALLAGSVLVMLGTLLKQKPKHRDPN